MSSFTKELRVKVLDNGSNYEVLDSFVYYKDDYKDMVIKVEKGFVTDFASVPRIFWSIFPPFGKYTKAAVLHDRLCEAYNHGEWWNAVVEDPDNLPVEFNKRLVKRVEADDIFLEAMKAINVPKFTRTCLYWSVRLYGILKYGKNA